MKKLLLLSLTILLFSCGDSASDDPQPFRDKYKNTYWVYGQGQGVRIFTLDNNILTKVAYPELGYCLVNTEGSFDNVSFVNTCVWDNITYEILIETEQMFVYRSIATDAPYDEDGDSCSSGVVTSTLKVVSSNEIVWTDEYDDGVSYTQRWFRLEDGVTPPTYNGCI